MGIEEIESRLGSLIQAETVSQLKSAIWKERLEGFYHSSYLTWKPFQFLWGSMLCLIPVTHCNKRNQRVY